MKLNYLLIVYGAVLSVSERIYGLAHLLEHYDPQSTDGTEHQAMQGVSGILKDLYERLGNVAEALDSNEQHATTEIEVKRIHPCTDHDLDDLLEWLKKQRAASKASQ